MDTIDFEDSLKAMAEINKLNKKKLSECKFTYFGKVVPIPKEDIEEWEFTGLNNSDFVMNYDWSQFDIEE